MQKKISEADLILNPDDSIYHLNLLPGDLGETIILVGDPDRVPEVSKYFDRVELKKQKREFVVHTGWLGKKRLSVVSTGIGVGNIDIVMNEIDALFNIDLSSRSVKEIHTTLNFIRLGTTGAAQDDIPVDSLLVANSVFSFDAVLKFYANHAKHQNEALFKAIKDYFKFLDVTENLVLSEGSKKLLEKFDSEARHGITFTCTGFYGAQGRQVRAKLIQPDFLDRVKDFSFDGQKIINFEMETSGIYGLGKLLDHECCSISTAVVNRIHNTTSKDIPGAVDRMIRWALEKLE